MLLGLSEIIQYIKANQLDTPEKDLYDFGVCTGGGTGSILQEFKANEVVYDKCWGFDSCEGLPDEAPGIHCPENWTKGNFNVQQLTGRNKEQVLQHFRECFKEHNFELIPGFFIDVLTRELAEQNKFKPALLISVDVDIYISTIQCVGYMMETGLIVPGTIIRYDDYTASNEQFGECRAHAELCAKHGMTFVDLPNPHVKIVVAQ